MPKTLPVPRGRLRSIRVGLLAVTSLAPVFTMSSRTSGAGGLTLAGETFFGGSLFATVALRSADPTPSWLFVRFAHGWVYED